MTTTKIGNKEISIIDGQQRVTTIFILLIACRQLAKKINSTKIANKIHEKICFEDSTTGEFLGSRVTASESIKLVFDHICKDDWDGLFPEKILGKQVKRQSNRIKPIYNYFWQKIEKFDQPTLSKLLNTLYNAYIVRIDIEDEIEAFKIFERTNARGLDLEASDLLKNYLFSNLGSTAEETWYRITELSGGTILKMLKYFYVSKKGKVSKSDLYKKLKQYGKEKTPQSLLTELEEFAGFYNSLRTADSANMKNYFDQIGLICLLQDQERFEDIYFSIEALRLFKITQMYPLIFSAIGCYLRSGYGSNKSFNPKMVRFFRLLENYHFINNAICERIGNEVESIYADFSKDFADSSDFDETSKCLYKELKSQIALKDEFTSRFTDISYQASSIPIISYIFDRINNFGVTAGQRVKIFNPDERVLRRNHNIEHFYPQNPLQSSKLKKLSDEEINNIGNLICISFRTNSKLGNLDPEDKAKKLNEELQKEIVNLPYVRNFLDEYNEKMSSWDETIIDQRAEAMSEHAYSKVWKFD